MDRVWKPLDAGGKRLYSVSCEYFDKDTGSRLYAGTEPPKLVMADSPRQAASFVYKVMNSPEYTIRVECYGKAVNVLMPKSWWEDGIPCWGNEVESDIEFSK